MTTEFLQNFAIEHGFIGSICTSAKTGKGITEAVSALVRQVLVDDLQDENGESILLSMQ